MKGRLLTWIISATYGWSPFPRDVTGVQVKDIATSCRELRYLSNAWVSYTTHTVS